MDEVRVYMKFLKNGGWYCQFFEQDLKTPLRRRLNFASDGKIKTMQERFGANRLLEDKAAFEHALERGSGGIWLILTRDQYQALN